MSTPSSSSAAAASAIAGGDNMEDVVPAEKKKKQHAGVKRKERHGGSVSGDADHAREPKRRAKSSSKSKSTGVSGGADAYKKIHRACGGIPRIVMTYLDDVSLCKLLSILPHTEGRAARDEVLGLKEDRAIAEAFDAKAKADYAKRRKEHRERTMREAREAIRLYPERYPFRPYPSLTVPQQAQRVRRIKIFIEWVESVIAHGGHLFIKIGTDVWGWIGETTDDSSQLVDTRGQLTVANEIFRDWTPSAHIAILIGGKVPKDGQYPPEPDWVVPVGHYPGSPNWRRVRSDRVAYLMASDGYPHEPYKWFVSHKVDPVDHAVGIASPIHYRVLRSPPSPSGPSDNERDEPLVCAHCQAALDRVGGECSSCGMRDV